MSLVIDVVTTVGVVGSLMIGWIQLTDQKRLQLRTWAFKLLTFASLLLVAGSGIWETIKFGTSDAPITRMDVLWLLANLWNSVIYVSIGVALAAYWSSPNRKKQVEPAPPPINQE